MRILHLISQTPDFTGSGKFIQQIMANAQKRGHENFLVAGCQGDFQPEPGLPDQVVWVRFDNRDLDFPVAGMSDAMPYESTVFSQMTETQLEAYRSVFKKKIEQALDQYSPELIHSHHLWIASALAREVIMEKGLDLPMVTTCHGTCLRQHHLCPHISDRITRQLKGIDRVMALSLSQRQEIMEGFGFSEDQVQVIAGGYNERCFSPRKKPEGPIQLVYAGKLCRAKGVPWLLKSLKKIEALDFQLHLAGGGSGEEKQSCLDLAAELGDRVVVHGPLSHTDLAALMGRSHLFILPSFFEGVPLVLMEALACGCRILSTDLPGSREILGRDENEMIRLFPLPELETIDAPYKADEAGMEEDLALMLRAFISRILESPEPDMEIVREKTGPYSWQKVFERIEKVYALHKNFDENDIIDL